MKNLWKKQHPKYVVWPVIIGGHLFVMKVLGDVVVQRNDEKQRADAMSAMFGSLIEFVGIDAYNAWEERMSDLYPIQGTPATPEELAADDGITFVSPIEVVELEAGGDPLDLPSEEVTDGEERNETAEASEQEPSEDQSPERIES